MPNKRSPTKKIYTVWLDRKKTEEIEKLASKNGMTKTEFAQYAFEQAIKNLKEEIKKKNESKNSSK